MPLWELGIVVVPDAVLIQGFANDEVIPRSTTLVRADGRVARIYKLPATPISSTVATPISSTVATPRCAR